VVNGSTATFLKGIDDRHAAWCRTEQWTKENGQYARGLSRWLAKTEHRYLDEPPKEKASHSNLAIPWDE
jgi:hypothetical protein